MEQLTIFDVMDETKNKLYEVLGVTIHRHQLKKLILPQNEKNEPNSHK
ncbi:TPA: hypothetical protein QCX59_003775 [Bacillus mycoides]|nr:hypothetical protein [Bacillus mycoides]